MNKNFFPIKLLFFCTIAICLSCNLAGETRKQPNPATSFLPMQIGNSWTMGPQNFTRIKDTIRIDNKLYYEFYALIGGDATDIKYLRMDDDNNLIEAYTEQQGKLYVHAKFNAKLGEEFFTLGDGSVNDYKVKVTEKTPERMTFEFDMVNHPKLKGSTHQVSYIKGQGIDDKWKSITIDGKAIR